ncbi:Nitrogen permease reactivator protein [Ciborinia camelliae]|nr:Nitrogen permease reactivator protein [Ciborinia camelliae]
MAEPQEPSSSTPTAPLVRPAGSAPLKLEGKTSTEGSPQVRFAAVNEQIAPSEDFAVLYDDTAAQEISNKDQSDLDQLSKTLHGTHLQERRMSHFAFEPVSLPVSRIPSTEENSREPSRYNTHNSSSRPSPHQSPRPSSMHSPPITPAATRSRDAPVERARSGPLQKVAAEGDPAAVTPQISPPGTSPSSTNVDASRPGSSGQIMSSHTNHSTESAQSKPHHTFSIGPTANDTSVTVSREPSPGRSATPSAYSRPFTPAGDIDDPYAASRRVPQPKNAEAIESRFRFTAIGAKNRQSPSSSTTSLPRSSRGSADAKAPSQGVEKRHTGLFGHKNHSSGGPDDSSSAIHKVHGSMSELKRFLKIGQHKVKRSGSPTPSSKLSNAVTKTPPFSKGLQQLPFGEDHGLTSKYGKFGKVLGAGAGGSVRLMKRSCDGKTFAVKEFRARHSYESEKEYTKKVTAEFCIGSTLHHGNIIETLDIVQEKGKWYEVMEYAPYDLFAVVMTGKMSREEVSCSFLQILSGVTYLHSMGLAHRDLKLDNVVVNQYGIMKIIDFGSASVFLYPFEGGITLSSGIVGSDPYLAPEVYDEKKYDPQPADIWSLAIIYCCMSLRRFPWKMPRVSDNSFKLFASPPSPGAELPDGDVPTSAKDSDGKSTHSANGPGSSVPNMSNLINSLEEGKKEPPKPDVIKGPNRLLRLIPRDARTVIGKMLKLDPKKRITMSEILEDPWVRDTVICRQDSDGNPISAPGHIHTLEPPSPQPSAKPSAK